MNFKILLLIVFLYNTINASNIIVNDKILQKEEKPTIIWAIHDFPPSYIIDGQNKGKGMQELVLKWFANRLPQYQHKIEIMTFQELHNSFKKYENICSAGLFKNPTREKYISFSKTAMLGLSSQIIISKYKKNIFKDYMVNGAIDLNKLLNNKNLTGAFEESRSYTKIIDKYIGKYNKNSNITKISSKDKIFIMLESGDIDYTFGSSTEATYFFRKQNIQDSKFITLPIKDDDSFRRGYFGCSLTPKGKNIIKDINHIIKTMNLENGIPPYSKYRLNWLDEEAANRVENKIRELKIGK